ncbi:MAG: hypothetical protein OQL09_04515 [Gammaproteobacteria bacterium]|nr:hypothetical protein [Gammaproteobacteria bacterium]
MIEATGGRAISTNGVVWDIELRAEGGREWGILNKNIVNKAFYRYGLWSQEDGLVNRPLAPHLQKGMLTEQCHLLIQSIEQRLDDLPFELIDSHELWLYDANNQYPLALLASCIPNARRPSPEPRYWTSHVGAEGVASQYKFPQAKRLITQVEKAASLNIKKHWIIRQPDGSGIIEASQINMPASEFPPYLLTEHWPDAEQSKLVENYINWIAPSLLTLQNLNRQQRQQLEKNLNVQAISIEHHRKLYQEIIDEKYINSALVQCRLQKANQ